MASRTKRRMSVAICSLRLRPVWSLRARAPISLGEFELDEVVDVFGLAAVAGRSVREWVSATASEAVRSSA